MDVRRAELNRARENVVHKPDDPRLARHRTERVLILELHHLVFFFKALELARKPLEEGTADETELRAGLPGAADEERQLLEVVRIDDEKRDRIGVPLGRQAAVRVEKVVRRIRKRLRRPELLLLDRLRPVSGGIERDQL